MPTNKVLPKKSLGVLMHPTCIPGGRVCGTFGKEAKEWIKMLHKYGIKYWQFLPLTPTDSTGAPYSSPSSFALNPWFLDMNDLIERSFIFISNKEELEPTNQNKSHFDFEVANDSSKKLGRGKKSTQWYVYLPSNSRSRQYNFQKLSSPGSEVVGSRPYNSQRPAKCNTNVRIIGNNCQISTPRNGTPKS